MFARSLPEAKGLDRGGKAVYGFYLPPPCDSRYIVFRQAACNFPLDHKSPADLAWRAWRKRVKPEFKRLSLRLSPPEILMHPDRQVITIKKPRAPRAGF